MPQDQIILKLLEDAGFTDKEAKVYLALLELGEGTVSGVAKITDLKRPIIYVLMEGLIKRGYASEIPNKKIAAYVATDPSVISAKLQTTTKSFLEMLPYMRTLHNKGGSRPKMSYFENIEGIMKVYNQMSSQPEAFFVANFSQIEKYFPSVINSWLSGYKGKRTKMTSRTLISDNEKEISIVKEFLEVTDKVKARTLPSLKESTLDFTLTKEKLSIGSLGEHPFVVVIESEELARSIQPIFELAWGKGREIR
ncbi:MAG: helix-turn-helix domain-containing protein [Parcubacteria group bacterium]|jgi:sugar-specific transcriptional regulator TrmB